MAEKCRYMEAAYPDLDAEDTCEDHRHDEATFTLALAMAMAFQEEADPSDEQVAWFLNDAGAVIDDLEPAPPRWEVTELEVTREAGLDFVFSINGIEYVLQQNDSGGHVETLPVSREQWDEWTAEDEEGI